MDLAAYPLKWTVNAAGEWVRIPFVRDANGDRPASVTAPLMVGTNPKERK